MNSQIFPELSESFIRQEHARLLEEAEKNRLLQYAKSVTPAHYCRFLFSWRIKQSVYVHRLPHVILGRR